MGLKTCVVIESSRTIEDKTTTGKRYYISSIENSAEFLNKIIRAHWGVENSLHWIMDVVFGEENCRVRTAIKRLRKNAGWDDGTLDKILRAEN